MPITVRGRNRLRMKDEPNMSSAIVKRCVSFEDFILRGVSPVTPVAGVTPPLPNALGSDAPYTSCEVTNEPFVEMFRDVLWCFFRSAVRGFSCR